MECFVVAYIVREIISSLPAKILRFPCQNYWEIISSLPANIFWFPCQDYFTGTVLAISSFYIEISCNFYEFLAGGFKNRAANGLFPSADNELTIGFSCSLIAQEDIKF